ncbi:MAG: hypothetical protein Q9218_007775 [Villophora microphyllina]
MMTGRLREVWSQVLDQDEADIEDDDNFFEIGGDPVAAMQLVSVAQESRLSLDAEAVFQHPKLVDMAVHAIAMEDVYPCPRMQIAFLKRHIQTKDPGTLVEYSILDVEGTQDTSRIQDAFEAIRGKNVILRTRFVIIGQEAHQVGVKDGI